MSFAPGEYYHLYSRGVEKRIIFLDEADHRRFASLLFYCNSVKPVNLSNLPRGLAFMEGLERRGETIVDIGAYCLMPNHFHLLVRAKDEGSIPNFMLKLMTAYSMYFNIKNQRKGRLFESNYQARHANTDKYLKYLFSYIHLNPVKIIYPNWRDDGVLKLTKTEQFLANYSYSSYPDYLGVNRDDDLILKKDEFPDYFLTVSDLKSEMRQWLQYEG